MMQSLAEQYSGQAGPDTMTVIRAETGIAPLREQENPSCTLGDWPK